MGDWVGAYYADQFVQLGVGHGRVDDPRVGPLRNQGLDLDGYGGWGVGLDAAPSGSVCFHGFATARVRVEFGVEPNAINRIRRNIEAFHDGIVGQVELVATTMHVGKRKPRRCCIGTTVEVGAKGGRCIVIATSHRKHHGAQEHDFRVVGILAFEIGEFLYSLLESRGILFERGSECIEDCAISTVERST